MRPLNYILSVLFVINFFLHLCFTHNNYVKESSVKTLRSSISSQTQDIASQLEEPTLTFLSGKMTIIVIQSFSLVGIEPTPIVLCIKYKL